MELLPALGKHGLQTGSFNAETDASQTSFANQLIRGKSRACFRRASGFSFTQAGLTPFGCGRQDLTRP